MTYRLRSIKSLPFNWNNWLTKFTTIYKISYWINCNEYFLFLNNKKKISNQIISARSSVDTSSMHRTSYEKTQRLEESKFVEPQYHIEEISKSKPIFVQPLSDPKPVSEGKNIHLECRLEPMGDPTMRVEWFQNGRPVTVGSRFRTYYDFGFVALDIVHSTVLDSGEYTVRATNHLGTAHTSACVRVIGKSDVVTETQHEQSLEQIQMLEDSSRLVIFKPWIIQ